MRRPYSHTYTHRCSDTHNTHYSLKRTITTQHVPAASGAQIGLARRTSLTPHTEAQPAETQAGQHVTIRHATRGQTTTIYLHVKGSGTDVTSTTHARVAQHGVKPHLKGSGTDITSTTHARVAQTL